MLATWVLGLVALTQAEPQWTCGSEVRTGGRIEGKGRLDCRLRYPLPGVDGASAAGISVRVDGLSARARGVARIESGLHMVWLPFRRESPSILGWMDREDAVYLTHQGEYDPELILDLTDDRDDAWSIAVSVETSKIDVKEGPARFDPRRGALPGVAANVPAKIWKASVRDKVLAALPQIELREQPSVIADRMRTSLAYWQPGFPQIELSRQPSDCAERGIGFGRRISTPTCVDRFDYAFFSGPSRAWRARFLALDGVRAFVEAFSSGHKKDDFRAAVTLASELTDRLDTGQARRDEALVEILDEREVIARRLLNVASVLVLASEISPEISRLHQLLHADAASLLSRPESVSDAALVTYALMYPEVLAPNAALERAQRAFARPPEGDVSEWLDAFDAAHGAGVPGLASDFALGLCELVVNGRLQAFGKLDRERTFDPKLALPACRSGFCESTCGGLGMASPELAVTIDGPDLTVLRGGRDATSLVTVIRGRAAPGHDDAQSLTLSADGVDWLVELGEPALPENSDVLAFARSRRAHNVPLRKDAPRSDVAAHAVSRLTSGAVSKVVVQGPDAVRTVTFVRPRLLVVRDEFSVPGGNESRRPAASLRSAQFSVPGGNESRRPAASLRSAQATARELRQIFHTSPDKQVVISGDRTVRLADGSGACLFMYSSGVGVEPIAGRADPELQGWVFRGEQPVAAPALEVLEEARPDGSGSITTYLVATPKDAGCQPPFSSDVAVKLAVLTALANAGLWGDIAAP